MSGLSMGWMIARMIVYLSTGCCIFWAIYKVFCLGVQKQWVSRGWQYLLEQTNQTQRQRRLAYQQQYEEIGAVDKLPLMLRWDQVYSQSTIQNRFPNLNTGMYSGLLLATASIAGICGLLLFVKKPGTGILLGLLLFSGVLAGGIFYVNLLRRKRLYQTEMELVPFLNIVDNFSKSEHDLFQIFELSVPYLKEPLRSAIAECSRQAATTGNRMEAVRDLLYRIEHPRFREMIQNLEICSKNDANYAAILKDMRDGLSAYMTSRKEAAGILKQGQIQMIVILLLGIPMVAMLGVVTQVPLTDMVHTLFGRIVIGYWVLLLLFIFYQMFFSATGRES